MRIVPQFASVSYSPSPPLLAAPPLPLRLPAPHVVGLLPAVTPRPITVQPKVRWRDVDTSSLASMYRFPDSLGCLDEVIAKSQANLSRVHAQEREWLADRHETRRRQYAQEGGHYDD